MSQWTHPICARCWSKGNPDRTPTTLRNPETERCCYCGNPATDGIYVRADPAILEAHEEHPDD